MPEQFVLKCTHDSGGLIICKDKTTLDIDSARKTIEKCLKCNYFYSGREWPYKYVRPRIIAEAYLENSDEGLHDYKIWCFGGKPKYIQYITGRLDTSTKEGFYDINWNLQDFSFHNPKMEHPVPKPKKLDKMLELAEKLADDLPFSRIDFYILKDESIKFGEITFFPMTGMETWKPEKMDEEFGKLIQGKTDRIQG